MLDSGPGALTSSMGMDSNWFRTLEDAFLDSYPGDEYRSSKGSRERFFAQKDLFRRIQEQGYPISKKMLALKELNSAQTFCELLKELNEDAHDFQERGSARSAQMRSLQNELTDTLAHLRAGL